MIVEFDCQECGTHVRPENPMLFASHSEHIKHHAMEDTK